MKFFITLIWLVAALLPSVTLAENAKFTFLKTVTTEELNQILNEQRTDFLKNETIIPEYQLPKASKATNAVDIYTVTYYTTIPERKNQRVKVSGLLALPKLADRSKIPLFSYQHGTVYDRFAVPSYAFQSSTPSPNDHRPESFEDRYMVALYGGNGYAVMAADYVGFGTDAKHNEAYLLKAAAAQSSFDLYRDVQAYLATQNIKTTNFFIGGWSQGGYNTTGFLQKLESERVPVKAAFTASAPNDTFAALNAVLFHPQETDSPFFILMIGQMIFSCENYGGPAGLAKATINPQYFSTLKSVYERTYGKPVGNPEALVQMMTDLGKVPLVNFIKEELRDPATFAASDFGKCLTRNEAYRQDFKSDLRMYFGTKDPFIRPRIGQLAYDYHLAVNGTSQAQSQSKITPIQVIGGTHRLTFITGSSEAKTWMDGLR